MRRPLKYLSIALASLLALFLLATLGLARYARTGAFHARIETAASRGLGMEVRAGALGLGFLPTPHLTLHDVRVRNRGVDVAAIDVMHVRFRLFPLLQRRAEPATLDLDGLHLLVKKGEDGVLDLVRSQPPAHKRAHGPMEIRVEDASVRYEDAKTGAWVEAAGCEARAHDVRTEMPDGRPGLQRVSLTGDIACKQVRAPKFAGTDFKAGISAGGGVYAFEPVSLQAFGAEGRGSLHADVVQWRYTVDLAVPQLDVARFIRDMGLRQLGEGSVAFAADIAAQGKDRDEVVKSASGSLSLQGKELKLEGYDLDGELKRFEHSQRFSLVDMGALFYAGPLGLAATKGYDFSRIKGPGGGTSPIHVLLSDWKVKHGVATASDVAMSTDTHRMALQGKLDFNSESFDGVTVAVVDAQGCVIARQDISGSFTRPKLEKPDILAALTAPVRRLVNKGENLLTQRGCKVFYSGSVKPY